MSKLLAIKVEAESRARKELEIPGRSSMDYDWKSLQTSKISSYEIPVRLRSDVNGEVVDTEYLEKFSEHFHRMVSYAFGHACLTTPYDDFVYILSLEKGTGECAPGYIPFLLSLHCHITAFVWAFEEWSKFLFEGRSEKVSPLFRSFRGEQELHLHPEFGDFVAHRICRSGATSILIQELSDRPIPMERRTTTSTLLRLLSVVRNCQTVLWDDADKCPDMEKVMLMLGRISDATSFSWNDFRVDRSDPESWEYVGRSH